MLGGGMEDERECADAAGSARESYFGVAANAVSHKPKGHFKMMKLNPGERQGWWSAKQFD
ncbi:hypothetical protein PI126_g19541 [Phytophthora idaei]|nr:hypothetical protein PI126_g19541 [Phytophthora idaei]